VIIIEFEYSNSYKEYKNLIIKIREKEKFFRAFKIVIYFSYIFLVLFGSIVLFEIDSIDDFIYVFDLKYILKVIIGLIIMRFLEYFFTKLSNKPIFISLAKKVPYMLGETKIEINDMGIKVTMLKKSFNYLFINENIKGIYRIEDLIYIFSDYNKIPIIIPIKNISNEDKIIDELSKIKPIEYSSLDKIFLKDAI